MSSMSSLFTPARVGALTLQNRIGMSALTRSRSVPTNVPNSINVEYYKQRAAGGAGLIVSEGTLISQQGSEWPNAPGIWSKEQVRGWKKVTDAVHEHGSHIFAQLWHLGRASHPQMPEQIAFGRPVYAPSAVAAKGGKFRQLPGEPGYVTPTPIDDPTKLIAQFKQAAINAKEAGFDGVELHGASGYLVAQFLDSNSNKRTDSWGGSIENRSRFGLETLKALVDVWGSDRVGVKLNPAGGYNDMGMPLQETLDVFSHFISEADKLRLAYINLVRYSSMLDPTGRGTPHDVIESYGRLVKSSSLWANCGFTPQEAAKFVEEGKVAGVFFGFLYITNPDLAKRIQYGKELNTNVDFTTLYGGGRSESEETKGYSDYPSATY